MDTWVVVVSQFNGTSTPKGSYSAKTGDNDCNVNSSRYSLSTALCESNTLSGQVWTKCSTRPDTQGRHVKAALMHPSPIKQRIKALDLLYLYFLSLTNATTHPNCRNSDCIDGSLCVQADCFKPRMTCNIINTLPCFCDKLVRFLPDIMDFTPTYWCEIILHCLRAVAFALACLYKFRFEFS